MLKIIWKSLKHQPKKKSIRYNANKTFVKKRGTEYKFTVLLRNVFCYTAWVGLELLGLLYSHFGEINAV